MEISKKKKVEHHPLFPSGEWIGFYVYSFSQGHRHLMFSSLQFRNNVISGTGDDDIGHFTWTGQYDKECFTCKLTKSYTSHQVNYWGHVDENGIWGNWKISSYCKGGFHIWPFFNNSEEFEEKKSITKPLKSNCKIFKNLEINISNNKITPSLRCKIAFTLKK